MRAFLPFLFLILYHAQKVRGKFCDEVEYTLINEIRRSTAYKSMSPYICDRGFIEDDKWYRFDSAAGNTMPTHNPGIRFCGAYVPIWLNGEHPTKENEEIDAKACAAVPFIPPTGCGISYNIKVVKCPGDFYLYRLKEPRQCSLAYCAGDKLPEACSPDGETLPVCPGAIPRISVQAGIKEGMSETEYVRLRCFWESPGNLTYVEFQARWYGDTKDSHHKIQRNFTGLQEHAEFLFESSERNSMTGYKFHKNVYCTVRARYITGTWSKWVGSNQIYTGIEVTPTFIPILNDCGERNREVIITLRPHLPIRVASVKVDLVSLRNQLIDEICVVGEQEFSECGLIFKKNHRVGRPLRFKLMTSCATGDKSKTQEETYQLLHGFYGPPNGFWLKHDFPIIKISRRKYVKRECKSTGDPHFYTFDRKRYYDFYGRGTFLLYRNSYYGTEIQVRQKACNGGTPSCNCGVAIKENLFYKIYDMCYIAPGKPWWENDVIPRFYTYQLRDFKLSRFYSKIKPLGSTTKIEVTLPSGIKVIVDRGYWGLNIHVFAPADPDHPSEGLCGNNNGNPDDDIGHWKTWSEFGEHWRIPTVTLFDYKGKKYEEEQIDDGCNKKICVCTKNNMKLCGGEAENICFPDLGAKDARAHHQGSGIGECRDSRPKRTLTPDDDTVDDQDAIPPFNPAVTSVNLTLTWPTPSGLTKDNVTEFCEKKILYSKAGKACGHLSGVDVEGLVQQCLSDIQATEDFSWAAANFGALETSCTATVFNNISSFKNTSDGTIELDTDVLTSLCPNDCSDHGNCTNSKCTCHEDYTAADCSLSLKASPLVYDIRKSGLCDRRRRPCRNVGIFAFPLLDSENLTCHVQEYKVIESAWNPSNSISLYPGLLVDLTEVKCSLPESPVNIGDFGDEGVTAAGLTIAVSNNRVNASKQSILFITYDSVCQECNTTTGCKLRTDACFISGHCFANNDSNPSDWCQQCFPQLSNASWSERIDNSQPIFTTSNTIFAFKEKEFQVQLKAKDPENRTIYYSFAQDKTFGASLTENGLFTWTKITNNSTVFKFNVTDECGAYSLLNVSVVIKKCPCQNSGECLPDYRYLDGAGNFTCSCPAEYTGVLCEVDVDECAAFKPCFNGRCSNKKPGFSCSCSAGYTGDLCQTEVDECESNPCFLGVSCTDLIASFRCGPCPNGYSGNGESCIRIDGGFDPCVRNPQVCHSEAKCVYNNGSYVCQCADGYIGDGKNNCTDVNECLQTPDNCHLKANCRNTEGSYFCECMRGYTGDGILNCSDINECKQSPSVCRSLAKCSNIEGSFSCQCKIGYTGNGIVNCTDVNECVLSPLICHADAQCINTIGSYSCQCIKGYFGDGKKNCTENKSPQFNTPSAIYAIMNTDLQIRIKADDPEGEDIVYILMSNGTLSTAQITEQGLLTVSDVKFNGTVYIRVEDERGAWNILILHVKAMQCPCENHGKCYRKQNIPYPVQPSHYFCQCEEHYTGHLCEIRPNPCDERPCYPGLKCLPAQNSEGFSCEDCPLLFKGDGKHCELNRTKDIEKNSVHSKMTLKNEEWDDQLTVKTSKVYKKLVSRVTIEIRKIYIGIPEFSYFIVKGFSRGSIVVDFELIFSNKVDGPLEPLLKVARTGKLGNMTFEMNEESDAGDDDGNTLDTTILIVIIVVAVVLLILIVFGVCRCIRRQRVHREEELRRKRESSMEDSKPVGISYQEAADGAAGEEMDLNVFDNEAVRLDEDTNLEP